MLLEFSFATIVYNIICLPSRTHGVSPYQVLFKSLPDLSFLKVFGCMAFSFLQPYNTHKFEFCSTPCCFFGYSEVHLSYICFDRRANKIYITCHCKFIEDKFFSNISYFIPEAAGTTDVTNWLMAPNKYVSYAFDPTQPISASLDSA